MTNEEQPPEEEKKEEEPMAVDAEDAGNADEWDDGDGDDWGDDAWDEEEEEDPVVAAAIEATRMKKELDGKIATTRITYRPPLYREDTIAHIVGDFTDWVPYTMHLHRIIDIQAEPSKKGEFYIEVKLAKGFRYRYAFEVDG